MLGLAVALAVLVLGQGGAKPAAAQPPLPPLVYGCYNISGDPVNVPVTVSTQFGLEPYVLVVTPSLLCLPASITGGPLPDVPHLKCYHILGHYAGKTVNLTIQGVEIVENNVAVGRALELCVPANKAFPPTIPSAPSLTAAHYECYEIQGPPLGVTIPTAVTQFGTVNDVYVGQPTRLCAPALKNGEGDLTATHLKCYNIAGPPLDPPRTVNLTTQFGVELNVSVGGPPVLGCAPVTKTVVGVGGIAELPDIAGASGEEAGTPAGGSGWSAGNYAALAGGLAAAVVALSAGAWYARRRWIR